MTVATFEAWTVERLRRRDAVFSLLESFDVMDRACILAEAARRWPPPLHMPLQPGGPRCGCGSLFSWIHRGSDAPRIELWVCGSGHGRWSMHAVVRVIAWAFSRWPA
jgi:hypothetical protein